MVSGEGAGLRASRGVGGFVGRGGGEEAGSLGSGGGLLKLSMDEDGLRELRDNMAAAAKIVKQHHRAGAGAGAGDVSDSRRGLDGVVSSAAAKEVGIGALFIFVTFAREERECDAFT